MLKSWREAKTLAIKSYAIEPEILIAMQEMYIEAKQLRKDNLKLLNSEDLLKLMSEYVRVSRADHYISPELEELIEQIEDLIDSSNLALEVRNDP